MFRDLVCFLYLQVFSPTIVTLCFSPLTGPTTACSYLPYGIGFSASADDRASPGKDGVATPTTAGTTDCAEQDGLDSRVIMVQERLLESLLLAPAEEQLSSSSSSSTYLLHQSTGDKGGGRAGPVSMDVEGEGGDSSGTSGARGGVTVGSDTSTGKSNIPTAIQVVASMVDSALQVRTVLLKYIPHTRWSNTTQTPQWIEGSSRFRQ